MLTKLLLVLPALAGNRVTLDIPMGFIGPTYAPVTIQGSTVPLASIEVEVCQASAFEFGVENRSPLFANEFYFGESPIFAPATNNMAGVSVLAGRKTVVESTLGGPSGPFAGAFDWSVALQPFDGTVDYAGASGASSGILTIPHVQRFTITDPAILAHFQQPEVPLFARRLGWWWFSATTGVVQGEVTGWSGARVHFTYIPAEPES
ncbi:MAG: hypothetical protein ACSLFI_07740 [Solirubrobacterales bacterium]